MFYWSNQIGVSGASSFAEVLKVNSTLTDLSLAVNIKNGYLRMRTLLDKHFNECFIESNQIGDSGGSSIAEGLKVNSTLTKLWLNIRITTTLNLFFEIINV